MTKTVWPHTEADTLRLSAKLTKYHQTHKRIADIPHRNPHHRGGHSLIQHVILQRQLPAANSLTSRSIIQRKSMGILDLAEYKRTVEGAYAVKVTEDSEQKLLI